MEVTAGPSSSPAPRSVDSNMSRSTSGSDDSMANSAGEWKRMFGQMQRRGVGDGGRRGRGGGVARGGSRSGDQRSQSRQEANAIAHLVLSNPPTDALSLIRHKILTTPLPPDTILTPTHTTYRSVVWKLLLEISHLDIASYLLLVSKGKSPSHDKIRNDTFRTLATDQGFKERVKEEKLIRLLDAFVWKHCDEASEGLYEFSYVQGMNVLAAPFLYTCKSEVEAFRCFTKFIEWCCPLYVQPTLAGVHRGLQVSNAYHHNHLFVNSKQL